MSKRFLQKRKSIENIERCCALAATQRNCLSSGGNQNSIFKKGVNGNTSGKFFSLVALPLIE